MESDSDRPPSLVRRRVLFSGRVQGVGFRFTTEAIASRFDITGFVRNLPDGRVELVAEGIHAELDRFQNAIENAMRGCINDSTGAETTATGEFASFGISF